MKFNHDAERYLDAIGLTLDEMKRFSKLEEEIMVSLCKGTGQCNRSELIEAFAKEALADNKFLVYLIHSNYSEKGLSIKGSPKGITIRILSSSDQLVEKSIDALREVMDEGIHEEETPPADKSKLQ